MTRRQSLQSFRERLFAEFWYLPDVVYDRVLSDVNEWAEAQPGGLDEPERLSGHLIVETFRTPS